MKYKIQSLARHLLLICGAAGFLCMTACQSEDVDMDPPEVEEAEEAEDEDELEAPAVPAPGTPAPPAE